MSANRRKLQAYEAARSLKTFFKRSTQWLKVQYFLTILKQNSNMNSKFKKYTDHMTAHCKSCHMIELVEEGAIFGQILFELGFLN